MLCSAQLWLTFVFMLWIKSTQSGPLFQGISIQKGFDVQFHPLRVKPMTLFKEKWSPFGRYGVRKGIQKRDLSLKIPAPVFEEVEEETPKEEDPVDIFLTGLRSKAERMKPFISNFIKVPTTESPEPPPPPPPPPKFLFTSISHSLPENEPKKEPPFIQIYGELPPMPPKPAEPIPEISFILSPEPVTPKPEPVSPIPIYFQPASPEPAEPLNPVFIQAFNTVAMRPIGPSVRQVNTIPIRVIGVYPPPEVIKPPPPSPATEAEVPPTEGPLLRGSKLALYFGNRFLQMVSQFVTNAKTHIGKLKSPPPPPPAEK